ncbi:hypothetical protein CEP54_016125, partial [Fusarium duplospermum]
MAFDIDIEQFKRQIIQHTLASMDAGEIMRNILKIPGASHVTDTDIDTDNLVHETSASKPGCTCGLSTLPTQLAGDPHVATPPSAQTSLGKRSNTGDDSNFAGPLKRTRIDDGGDSERTVNT